MIRNISTYRVSLIVALALAAMLVACIGPRKAGEERAEPSEETTADGRGYDPLELPRDREVVPEKYPRSGSIETTGALVDAEPDPVDSATQIAANLPVEIDTLNNQVYRVQLFTSKLYGEARKAVTVAEEIFDQPVYLDYEVPYYKVRVGNFARRGDAEQYVPKVKAAGYERGWVVMVNLAVKEAAPLYEDELEAMEDSLPEGVDPSELLPLEDE